MEISIEIALIEVELVMPMLLSRTIQLDAYSYPSAKN
jgi:hypothetical protein